MSEIIFLEPVLKEMLWGSEKWLISAHKNGDCCVRGGKYDGMTLSELWKSRPELFGSTEEKFPLLIKIIDAREDLSIQVHPDDKYAFEHESGERGKCECWYVAHCGEDTKIAIGHNAKSKDELKDMISRGQWEKLIREIPVKKGDFFQIEPGTLHAIKGGTLIFEIQQSSDVTYRVYDYDRVRDGKKRELHLEKSIDVIKCPFEEEKSCTTEKGVSCRYYTVEKLSVSGSTRVKKDCFWNAVVVEGEGSADGKPIKAGEGFIVPMGYGEVCFEGEAELLISYTENNERLRIGVDLGGTNIAAGLVDEKGKIVKKISAPTKAERDIGQIADDIARLCKELAGEKYAYVEKVGVGCPGTIDRENGEVIFSNNIPMKNVKLGKMLEKRLSKPVTLENDANAAALGEYALTGAESFMLITLGTGVGGGAVIDGKLYRGFNGAGFEPGHIIINTDGEKCSCGNRGCLEAYASVTALIRQTKAAMEKYPDSLMNEWAERKGCVNGKTAFDCAKMGDAAAKDVVETYIKYLGAGLVSVINLLQPEYVAIGGGLSHEGEYLLEPLRKYVYEHDFNKYLKHTRIEAAQLFNDAGIVGAV